MGPFFLRINALAAIIRLPGENGIVLSKTRCLPRYLGHSKMLAEGWAPSVGADNENKRNLETIGKINGEERTTS